MVRDGRSTEVFTQVAATLRGSRWEKFLDADDWPSPTGPPSRAPRTLAEFAAQDPQRGISDKWDQLHVPICLSTRGLFARVEVRDFDR